MQNKKENPISFLLLFISILITITLLLPVLSVADSDSSFLGYEVVLGTKFADLGSFASGKITFSILAVMAFLAPLVAGLLVAFTKQSLFISAMLFALGAVLLFLLPVYTTATMTVFNAVVEIDINWTYAYGLFIAALLAALGAMICLYKVAYK